MELILKYQELDKELNNIEQKVKKVERDKANLEKIIKNAQDTLIKIDKDRAKGVVEKMVEIEEAQTKALGVVSKMSKSDTKEMNDDEMKSLDIRVNKAIDYLSKLEKHINRVSKDVKDVNAEYAQLGNNIKKAKRELQKVEEQYKEVVLDNSGELDTLKKSLSEVEKDIKDKELLEKYKKARKGRDFPIVVEVMDNICSACSLEISGVALNNIKSRGYDICDECGRIIFTKK